MTREEARNLLKNSKPKGSNAYSLMLNDALDMAIKVLEQEPKQVELEGDGYSDGEIVYDYGKCPKCGWEFEEGDKDWEEPYCCHCGQKLHWFEPQESEIENSDNLDSMLEHLWNDTANEEECNYAKAFHPETYRESK